MHAHAHETPELDSIGRGTRDLAAAAEGPLPSNGRRAVTACAELGVLNLALPRADGELLVRMLLARVRLERKKLRNAQGKPDRPVHPALLRRMYQIIEQNTRLASWLEQELALSVTHPAVPGKDL